MNECNPSDRDNQDDSNEGMRKKNEAQTLLEMHRKWLLNEARRILLDVLLVHGRASIDDVISRMVSVDVNPVWRGPIPVPLDKAGIIRRAGYFKSTRQVAHARPISVWELISPEKARQWLADHPETPELPLPQLPLFRDDLDEGVSNA